jgi:hypothetical protein
LSIKACYEIEITMYWELLEDSKMQAAAGTSGQEEGKADFQSAFGSFDATMSSLAHPYHFQPTISSHDSMQQFQDVTRHASMF